MKHYLFLRRFLPSDVYGGCEEHLLSLFKNINYEKHEITLAVSRGKKDILGERIKQNNLPIRVIEFTSAFKSGFWKRLINMLVFLKAAKPTSVVYINGGFGSFNLADVFAGYICTRGNVFMVEHLAATMPYKQTRHYHFGFIPGLGLWIYKKKLFYLLRAYLSKRILAVSKEVKEKMVKLYGYPEKKIYVNYKGIDIKKFTPDIRARQAMRRKFNISEDQLIVISTARLSAIKCLPRLINAFDVAWRQFKNSWLFIVGDGPLRQELEGLAGRKLSKERIKFLGFHEDISKYLKMSDIFVLPSDNEGLSNAMLESMSIGLVSVITEAPGAKEVVQNGVNGYLVERSEQGVLDGLMKALSLAGEERKLISSHARELIERNFDMEKGIKEILNTLGLYAKERVIY